jgi:hypothetical protein
MEGNISYYNDIILHGLFNITHVSAREANISPKDGTDIMEIYAGASTSANGPGSNMIVYDIDVGSKIFVKVHENYHNTGETLNGPRCTFSGFLLYSNA